MSHDSVEYTQEHPSVKTMVDALRATYELSRKSLKYYETEAFLTDQYPLPSRLAEELEVSFGNHAEHILKHIVHHGTQMETYRIADSEHYASRALNVAISGTELYNAMQYELQVRTDADEPILHIEDVETKVSTLLQQESYILVNNQKELLQPHVLGYVDHSYIMSTNLLLRWCIQEQTFHTCFEQLRHAYQSATTSYRGTVFAFGRVLRLQMIASCEKTLTQSRITPDDPWKWNSPIVMEEFLHHVGSVETMDKILHAVEMSDTVRK